MILVGSDPDTQTEDEKEPWWRRAWSHPRMILFREKMRRLSRRTNRWLARLPLWGASLVSLVLFFLIALLVLVGLGHPKTPDLLGVQIYGWRRVLTAAGVVTLSAAIVGLVVSYRKQRDAEDSKNNTEFANAATQLGANSASLRIAGVYAMAALADRSTKMRQRCIDVLCGHLRLPYDPENGDSNVVNRTIEDRLPSRTHIETIQYVPGEREVRFTIIREIRDHLRSEAKTSWRGHNFDFTGAVFDGGNFEGVHFTGSQVSFRGAHFAKGDFSFADVHFTGGHVSFDAAHFTDGTVKFHDAQFNGATVEYDDAHFTGG